MRAGLGGARQARGQTRHGAGAPHMVDGASTSSSGGFCDWLRSAVGAEGSRLVIGSSSGFAFGVPLHNRVPAPLWLRNFCGERGCPTPRANLHPRVPHSHPGLLPFPMTCCRRQLPTFLCRPFRFDHPFKIFCCVPGTVIFAQTSGFQPGGRSQWTVWLSQLGLGVGVLLTAGRWNSGTLLSALGHTAAHNQESSYSKWQECHCWETLV